jgi:hypothetical protein
MGIKIGPAATEFSALGALRNGTAHCITGLEIVRPQDTPSPSFCLKPLKMFFFYVLERCFILYAPYSFLLISNKFWMGERVGGSSAIMLLNLTCAVMLLNRTGGVVWALKPP